MDVFYPEYRLNLPIYSINFQLLQNRFVHRGLFEIVAKRLHCYPTHAARRQFRQSTRLSGFKLVCSDVYISLAT